MRYVKHLSLLNEFPNGSKEEVDVNREPLSLLSNAPIGVLVAEQLGPEFYSIISSYLL